MVTGLGGKFDIGGIGIDGMTNNVAAVGQQIVIDDDGPTASANAVVQLDDDDVIGAMGNPGEGSNTTDGAGTDDVAPMNATGTLEHSFGADGAGSIEWLTTVLEDGSHLVG